MTFYNSPLLNENNFSFSSIKHNTEVLSISIQSNSILNYGTNLLSLKEEKDEIENLLFIHDENIERYNNSKHIFTTEPAQKKEGLKRKKNQKKLSTTNIVLIISLLKFKYII